MNPSMRDEVKKQYASVAESELSNRDDGVREIAAAFGYSESELASIPDDANMGLSCGNPTAFASLAPGEVVVDLGSGGGLDVFLAAEKVGPTGKAIGIDMTESMVERARQAAQKGVDGKPFTNVEFHLASIDSIPLPDDSVDCVISNCVINLADDKRAVFQEIFRILKPGGRLAVSDIVLKKTLPPEIQQNIRAFTGCIAGAITMDDYRQGLQQAGFESVVIRNKNSDLNVYGKIENQIGCCSPTLDDSEASGGCCGGASPTDNLLQLMQTHDLNEFAASAEVYALKPKTD